MRDMENAVRLICATDKLLGLFGFNLTLVVVRDAWKRTAIMPVVWNNSGAYYPGKVR